MSNNLVDIRTIGSLLDGKNHFYVPSYQRGYRWTKKQVEDLLGDLYSFRKQYENRSSNHVGNFYCLQPVIVRKITDFQLRSLALGEINANDESVNLWELVDGQQRLTSIFILLSYLIRQKKMDKEEFGRRYRSQLYSIYYESRPETFDLMNNLGDLDNCSFSTNIDSVHIVNAFKYIDEWFDQAGLDMSKRYVGGEGEMPEDMWDCLLKQLTTKTEAGPTKVIWYQLSTDDDTDPIKEFTSINNGKIPLTDTELVKALLLQKKNFEYGNDVLQQAKVSLIWEQMENALQDNDFWCFVSDEGIGKEDRMEKLLKLVYQTQNPDKPLIEPGDLFRFYYKQIDGVDHKRIQSAIQQIWTELVDSFRILEDWYNTPEIYNYVGFLVQSGKPLVDIFIEMTTLKDKGATFDDIIKMLEDNIRQILPRNIIEGGIIQVQYPRRPELRKILLLLNIDLLSSQLREIRINDSNDEEVNSSACIFKFPFGLYRSQEWDIEHIDSATTNQLQDKEMQEEWVRGNFKDLDIPITEALQKKMEAGEWADLIGFIKRHENEDETEEYKNFIGNLTLLDSSTNREYGNAIFSKKRMKIIEKIEHGRYVLPCTQYVFLKFFDKNSQNKSRTQWTLEDKMQYHDFIVRQIGRFF